MILSTSDTPTMPECSYKICGASKEICRIRFDFIKFVIADPITGTASTTAATTATATLDYSIGHCHLDRFSISSMGNKGTPIICGTNTGQHSNNHFIFKDSYSTLSTRLGTKINTLQPYVTLSPNFFRGVLYQNENLVERKCNENEF